MNEKFVIVMIDLEDADNPTVIGIPKDEDPVSFCERLRNENGIYEFRLLPISVVGDFDGVELISEKEYDVEVAEQDRIMNTPQNMNIQSVPIDSSFYTYDSVIDDHIATVVDMVASFDGNGTSPYSDIAKLFDLPEDE